MSDQEDVVVTVTEGCMLQFIHLIATPASADTAGSTTHRC